MNKNIKILIGAVLVSTSVATSAYAGGSDKAVVIDNTGSVVKSILSGNCVRTKWQSSMDECAPKQAAKPAKKPVVKAAEKKEPIRTVTKEHKRSYVVFFNFNSSRLTAAAKDVLRKLFNDTKGSYDTSFEITGHADRVGSDAYNVMISEKRALSVKYGLAKIGAKASDISVQWKGESQPLVKTKDGIKEPQNRRAEIKVITKKKVRQ